MANGEVFLIKSGMAIPVHKASETTEPISKNERIESNCHSMFIRNTGTSIMTVNGEPFRQGEFKVFTPPILNVINVTKYDIKFDNSGTNEAWVTRSIIEFCFE